MLPTLFGGRDTMARPNMSRVNKRPVFITIDDSDSDEPAPKRHQVSSWQSTRPDASQQNALQLQSSRQQASTSASSSFVEEPEPIDLTQNDRPERELELYGTLGLNLLSNVFSALLTCSFLR
jgi:hypothetical protein